MEYPNKETYCAYYLKQYFTKLRKETNMHREPRVYPSPDVVFEGGRLSFEELERYFLNHDLRPAYDVLSRLNKEVCEISKDMDHSFKTVSTMYVLQFFIDKQNVLKQHNVELRKIFGNVEFHTTEKLFKIVMELKNIIEDDFILKEIQKKQVNNEDIYLPELKSPTRYQTDPNIRLKIQRARERQPKEISLNQGTFFNKMVEYSEQLLTTKQSIGIKSQDQQNDRQWLMNKLKKYPIKYHITDEEYLEKILSIMTNKNEDEISSELIRFLGLSNIKFVEILCMNQSKIKRIAEEKIIKGLLQYSLLIVCLAVHILREQHLRG